MFTHNVIETCSFYIIIIFYYCYYVCRYYLKCCSCRDSKDRAVVLRKNYRSDWYHAAQVELYGCKNVHSRMVSRIHVVIRILHQCVNLNKSGTATLLLYICTISYCLEAIGYIYIYIDELTLSLNHSKYQYYQRGSSMHAFVATAVMTCQNQDDLLGNI